MNAWQSWKALLFSSQGRVSRKTFWIFALVSLPIAFIATAGLMSLAALNPAGILGPIGALVFFAYVIAHLAALINIPLKRMHDMNKDGRWFWILLMPALGILVVFVQLGFVKGTEGRNRFGPDPLSD